MNVRRGWLHRTAATAQHRWRHVADRSPLSRLGQQAVLAAAMSVAAKTVGFGKEILVASAFGLSDGLEVYLVAFVLIGFPLSILLNAIQTTLISNLASTGGNSARAGAVYSAVALVSLGLTVVALPIWLLLLDRLLPLIAVGFAPDKLVQLKHAVWWLIPYYLCNGLNLLGYGVLQARQRFVLNGFLPALTPFVTILFVLFHRQIDDWMVLVMALNAGTLAELLAINIILFRARLLAFPAHCKRELATVFRGARSLLPGTLVLAIGPVAEQSIAASLGGGAVAALGYGYRLPAALNGVVVTAIGITVLPAFVRLLAEGQLTYCRHSLEKAGRWLLAAGLLLACVLALLSDVIVTEVYQRGAFDLAASQRVVPIQQVYFFQLPFALIAMLSLRTLAALGRNAAVSLLMLATVVIHIALAFSLGHVLGPLGIACAATIASSFTAFAAFFWARWQLLKDSA